MFWWRKWPSPECRSASHSSPRTSRSRVTASTENFKYSDSRNGKTKKSTFTLVNGASWSNGYGCITHGAKGPGMESPWRMKNCLCIFMFCKKIIISKIVPNGANIKKTLTPTIKSVTLITSNVSMQRDGQHFFVNQNQKTQKRQQTHKEWTTSNSWHRKTWCPGPGLRFTKLNYVSFCLPAKFLIVKELCYKTIL